MAKPKKKGNAGSGTKKKQIVNLASKGTSKAFRTQAQNLAAVENLKKAREAKARYAELRKEGFNRANVNEAIGVVADVMNRAMAFKPQNNPAFAKFFDEIGGALPQPADIENMTNSEYYKFATSLRALLNHPLSGESGMRNLQDKLLYKILADKLVKKEGVSKARYLEERYAFIKQNKDTASKAFEIYRKLESTHAGLILRGKIAPEAYGSDNLIVDLFDFVENDFKYDSDIDAAVDYWREQLEDQYAFEEEYKEKFKGKEITKFDWEGRESYAAFVRRKTRK